ncbi:MAG: hypothetical protein PF448_06865, partial [Bacteroidales bacterium]|nr:hypothetical protein [Bacteroidales bacterium]
MYKNVGELLGFESFYPEEDIKDSQDYLCGNSKSLILRIVTKLLSLSEKDENSDIEIIKEIFSKPNAKYRNFILNTIASINQDKRIKIFNPYSSLKIFEDYFYSQEKSTDTGSQNAYQFEVNFFKAYLTYNSKQIKEKEISRNKIKKLDTYDQPPMILFCSNYPTLSLENFIPINKLIVQTIKAIKLFQLLETKEETNKLVNVFLEKNKVSSWKEYLNILFIINKAIIENNKSEFSIKDGKYRKLYEKILDRLLLSENTTENRKNFLKIRNKPIYKTGQGQYR